MNIIEEIKSKLVDLGIENDWRRLVEYEDESGDGQFQEWLEDLPYHRQQTVLNLLEKADKTGKMPTSKAYLEFLNP